MKKLFVAAAIVATCLTARAADPVFVEAEMFDDHGGWSLDQQFMDIMGSPYLLAHGLGDPVKDAKTAVTFPRAGTYRVWVRTKDWVAPWKVEGAPGKFQLVIDGKPLDTTFGTKGADWDWQDGGTVKVGKVARVALHDLTGFEGRCDAILFTEDLSFRPPKDKQTLDRVRREWAGLPKNPVTKGEYDLVVVGGGIAGTAAAVSAARYGLKVALVQDRPVLGGNGSSEVRVWPEGKGNYEPYPRIGDVVKELVPEKTARDGNAKPAEIYADTRKFDVVQNEPNLTVFLEQRVIGVEASGGKIKAVIAQHTRNAGRTRITGRNFSDCTGDAAVGFLAGADFDVTKEDHMGASNLWRVEESANAEPFPKCLCDDTNALSSAVTLTAAEAKFPLCPWAVDLKDKPFPGRPKKGEKPGANALNQLGGWFWESGFDRDPIQDMEIVRDLNLRAMYGAWDVLKNVDGLYPNHKLEWAAFIAGKRESRRLLGDVILEVEDIRTGKEFEDGAFPCTWHIDLHFPHDSYDDGHKGDEFISDYTRGGTYVYKQPYWGPYRTLYSRNIDNLFMAGRDISVTHDALGAVRVMRTCGMMGEVVGMAASLCKKYNCTPREVYKNHLDELKALLKQGAGKKNVS